MLIIQKFLQFESPRLFLNQNIDGDKKADGLQRVMGDYVYKFWHLLDETLNAILFILIGLEVNPILKNF